jgi:hypothetical protein
MPPQAGSITILADDEPAAELLSCLRENLRQLRVEIAEPDGHHVWVTDHSKTFTYSLLCLALVTTLRHKAWRPPCYGSMDIWWTGPGAS